MTVTATSYAPITYNGNGSTTVFNVTFQFYEIAVIHIDSSGNETEWTENTHYTVTGGEGSTGSITVITTAPATGEKLRIERRTSKDQPRDYDLDNAVLEAALQQSDDRLAMILQELDYDNRRRPAISKTNFTAEVEFPTASTGNVLSWGSDGNLANTALVDLNGVAISALTTTASLEDTDLLPLYDNSAGDNAAITWANVKTEVSTALNLGALASLDTVDTDQIEDRAVTAAKILDANVTASKLADTAVTAGSYTNTDITVDAQGRITSAADGSVGIWEHISTTEVTSAVSSLDFTNLSAFKMLRLNFHLTPVNDGASILARTSTDNGLNFDAGSGDYCWVRHYGYAGGNGADGSNSETFIRLQYSVSNGSLGGIFGTMIVGGFNSTSHCSLSCRYSMRETGTNYLTGTSGGMRLDNTARDAIRLLFDNGNIASGYCILEGVRS